MATNCQCHSLLTHPYRVYIKQNVVNKCRWKISRKTISFNYLFNTDCHWAKEIYCASAVHETVNAENGSAKCDYVEPNCWPCSRIDPFVVHHCPDAVS